MRLSVAIFLLAASSGAAFAPSSTWGVASRYGEVSSSPALHSTVEQVAEGTVVGITSSSYANGVEVPSSALSASEINSRLQRQMEKLSKKDGTSRKLSKEVSSKTAQGEMSKNAFDELFHRCWSYSPFISHYGLS